MGRSQCHKVWQTVCNLYAISMKFEFHDSYSPISGAIELTIKPISLDRSLDISNVKYLKCTDIL